ncbi:MAG: universal stress protein [Thermoplasmata archaeon]|nr:universal stress protein [Thermoplasmata archaeon]
MAEIRSVAVGIDGSDQSELAFDWAVSLAKLASSSLTLVGVVSVHRAYPSQPRSPVEAPVEERRHLSELLSRFAARARSSGVGPVESLLLEGVAVDALLNFLDDRKPDLMVLGARGLSASRRLLLGSVSDGIVHHAHGSILVVRPRRPDGPLASG